MVYFPLPDSIPGCDIPSHFDGKLSPEKFWKTAGPKYAAELLAAAPKNIVCGWTEFEDVKDNPGSIFRCKAIGSQRVAKIYRSNPNNKIQRVPKYHWTILDPEAFLRPVQGRGQSDNLESAKRRCDSILKKLGWILVD